MYRYPTSSGHRLLPCSLGCLLAPNHPVRATKQPLRLRTDFQTSPLLQQAWPERMGSRNRKDVLGTPWADSEKWLELLSFSLWCGCESSSQLQGAAEASKMVLKSISRDILLYTLVLFSVSPSLLPCTMVRTVLPVPLLNDGSGGLPLFSHQ